MRLLDRYIIRQFLGTFAFMIGVFCVIAVVFDVAENIDDLIHSEASLWRILTDYYLNFCLNLGNTLSAFIVFLTIIWFTSRLAQRSEIIATLAAGVSLGRLMRPYMVAATLLVAGSLLLSHVILPHANSTKVDFEFEFIHKDFYIAEQNMYREVAPGTMVYFRSMAPMRSVGYRFVMDCWVGGSAPDGGERRLAETQPGALPMFASAPLPRTEPRRLHSTLDSTRPWICAWRISAGEQKPYLLWTSAPSMR
jgi:lipopolysaccharide export system permease protein